MIFNNLLLSITGDTACDLYDKLYEQYLSTDSVELEGERVFKTERIQTLPPVVHIQLQVSGRSLSPKNTVQADRIYSMPACAIR